LEAWLRKQPREIGIALAGRAALRVLPIVWAARGAELENDWFSHLVLPVFRATGAAWAVAAVGFAADAAHLAASAASDVAAAVAGDIVNASGAASDAASAAFAAASDPTGAVDFAAEAVRVANPPYAANNAAVEFWSSVSADATLVEEGRTALGIARWPLWPKRQGHPDWLRSLWHDMKATLHAVGQDWEVWTIWYDDRLEGRPNDEARDFAFVRVEEALWEQGPAVVNAEIKRFTGEHQEELERLNAAIVATRHSLDLLIESYNIGPGEQREVLETFRLFAHDRGWLRQLREAVATGLTAEAAVKRMQNDARAKLQSQTEPYQRELLHDLDDLANRLLHRLTGQDIVSAHNDLPLAPIENVLSVVSFGWTSSGTITVVAGAQNWPVFPFQGGEQDHANRLEACRVLATDIARSLRSGRWNARSDYSETLDQYAVYLPAQPGEGNFLLADAEARVIRAMFAAEQDFLPVPLAAKLKVLLEQHIGLRAYYPAMEEFYESVRSGHLEAPLPIDAVEGFILGVRDNTPTLFEPNVADILENSAQPLAGISPVHLEASTSDSTQPAPPPDPLGEVDPEKSRRYTLGSAVNALWKAVQSGEKAGKTVEGWSTVIATLGPNVVPILEWLRSAL